MKNKDNNTQIMITGVREQESKLVENKKNRLC